MSQDTSTSVNNNPPLEPIRKRATFPRSLTELVTNQLVPGDMAKSQALHTNMGVDYVIVFRFQPEGTIYSPPNGKYI